MFIPKPLEATLLNTAEQGPGDTYLVVNYIYKTVVLIFTGVGDTTCIIEVSNDGSNWVTMQSFTDSGYYETDISFKYIRANITSAGGKTVKADLTANK